MAVHMTFGKFKGKAISTVPLDYLQWMIKSDTFQKQDAEAEIYRRETGQGTGEKKEVTISLRAIDMASMSLQHMWIPSGQGVATWLFDELVAAVDNCKQDLSRLPVGGHTITYHGIRFEIDSDLQLLDVYPLEESLHAL